jgi:hypothetical protein
MLVVFVLWAPLANKQLRYCARFVVICLLFNRREMV